MALPPLSIRLYPTTLYVKPSTWEAMGRPERINISLDPIEAIVTIQPDPEGAYSLFELGRRRRGYRATIRAIEGTMPTGVYEPISLGRFEGVFKLTRLVKPDYRPNSATYKFRDRWLGMKPSRGALAQRARRLRELSERMEEEREKTIHRRRNA